jgi:hypothetical protein
LKLTITLEGEPGEDLRSELLRVLHVNGQARTDAVPAIVDWTPEDLGKFWRGLKDDVRPLLVEIAKHAPTYSFADLRKDVGLKGLTVAGRMSSVGHQQRKFPNRPPVVTRDWSRGLYHVDMKIAGWIIAISAGRKVA